MKIRLRVCLGLVPAVFLSVAGFAQAPIPWKIHDLDRPLPPIVDPGTPSTQETPGKPPSDAVVLFDGRDLSNWQNGDKSPARWKVENGYMEVVARRGVFKRKKLSEIASCMWNLWSRSRRLGRARSAGIVVCF